MKNIFVRKIFKYDPTVNGKYSRYDGYRLMGLRKLDPEIIRLKRTISGIQVEKIYCSGLRRGKETAKLLKKHFGVEKVNILPKLNEIVFDLEDLLTKDEYQQYGSDLMRKRFIESFAKDCLVEKRKQIKRRMDELIIAVGIQKEENILLVSHSFFMKILQVYLKDGELFDKPKKLEKFFNMNQKTFEFGEGFEFGL